jgi:hypothetical protein
VKVAAKEWRGFPISYSSFDEHSVNLAAPLSAGLTANTAYQFELTVPGAKDVFVKTADQRISLAGYGDTFQGSVTAPRGDLFVFATFPGRRESTGLLKYRVE